MTTRTLRREQSAIVSFLFTLMLSAAAVPYSRAHAQVYMFVPSSLQAGWLLANLVQALPGSDGAMVCSGNLRGSEDYCPNQVRISLHTLAGVQCCGRK